MSINVKQCQAMSSNRQANVNQVNQGQAISIKVKQCQSMSINVGQGLTMSIVVK